LGPFLLLIKQKKKEANLTQPAKCEKKEKKDFLPLFMKWGRKV